MSFRRLTASEGETIALGAELGRALTGGELIALEGPLGAGKTRFVQGLALGLGLDPAEVSSPTFVLCRHHGGRLVHVDAFRLEGPCDLASIGWDEWIEDPALVVAVEWSSRIAAALPAERIEVTLEHEGPESRLITIAARGHLSGRLERLDQRAVP